MAKKTPATNEKAFNESDMTLSAEAIAKINEAHAEDEKGKGPDLDDDQYFQVIPKDETETSTVVDLNKDKDKETTDGDDKGDGDEPPKPDSESQKDEQSKDEGDKGDEGEKPKTVSYKDLAKDVKEGTDVLIEDHSGKEVSTTQLINDRKELQEAKSNDENWQKTNTEKSQTLAADRKKLDDEKVEFDKKVSESAGQLTGENVTAAAKKLSDDTDFLSESDKWFDGKDNNPIQELLNAINTTAENSKTAKATMETDNKAAVEAVNAQIEADISEIQTSDKSYKDEAKLSKLSQFAGENGLTLPVAKKVMEYDEISGSTKTLTDKVAKLTKELTERNAEVKKLRARPGGITEEELEPDEISSGPGIEGYEKPADSWEEAEKRIKKKVG